jgi:hypothetical protein
VIIQVTERELAHIRAGLEALEDDFRRGQDSYADTACDEGKHCRMTVDQLQALSVKLSEEAEFASVLRFYGEQQARNEPELKKYIYGVNLSDELELDDFPMVSASNDDREGAFVQAWVWVPTP